MTWQYGAAASADVAKAVHPLSSEEMLRELDHRCANELQMVVSLLQYSAHRAISDEAREALSEAAHRVGVVIEHRLGRRSATATDLKVALRGVVQALAALAEPRGITIELHAEGALELHGKRTLAIALCVNELITNAIKHAYRDARPVDGRGWVNVEVVRNDGAALTVIVEDGGSRLPDAASKAGARSHQGLDLVSRLVAANGGLMLWPDGDSKKFEMRFSD